MKSSILIIWSLVILTVLGLLLMTIQAKCETPMGWGYTSFCKDSDIDCIRREASFYIKNQRGPVTDIELTTTYNVTNDELFSTPAFHTIRLLPREFKGCSNDTISCDAFPWIPKIHGMYLPWSIK